MRKILIVSAAAILLGACTHDIVRTTDFKVTLDHENTYMAGEPVRFNIEGEVDNILFYSGETAAQYKYKDRYTVATEDVNSVNLALEFQARYGSAGAMEVWVSDSFAGLDGENGDTDKATVKAMYDGGMQGWTKLDYQEGASTKWTEQDFDMSGYIENFCIAFHWCPAAADKTQRTYWINGALSLDLKGAEPTSMDISELGFKVLNMNEEVKDPYKINAGNGSVILNNPNTASLIFQGVGANALPYALDVWAISTPTSLNKVANDKGTVIKNIQNYLHTYEYVWDEPGTYNVTFVGTNSNYLSSSQEIKEFQITILENSK